MKDEGISQTRTELYKQQVSSFELKANSQSSTCHQCFYITNVYFQGFVVFIHGFHMATMFEVVHPCTDT